MPPHYEDAAHILLFLTRAGLVISPWIDSRIVIMRLAHLMDKLTSDARGLTHYGAAVWMIDNLQASKFTTCDEASRAKILAILGTKLGDFLTMQAAARRHNSRAS